ncbi:MAG TPA: xanthine dehydrogenase family protein molybdopterin-binding subunit [Thermoleophilaceae bacterium]|nr:xanthine dehydrogenase family protein molybdopterin-binding subunit [Thermoleophilaceae bacterium]
MSAGRLVGRPVRRREDERILRGGTRYLDDIDPPGAAHVAFVRSSFAHARITGVNVPDGLDGVTAVITAADLEGRVSDLPVQGFDGGRVSAEGHPVLARDEVRYAGQPVAAVLAESRALAEDAAELVEVDYEPLEPVLAARSSDVTMTHWHKLTGDVDGAFASAEHVVRASHALPRLAPVPMETRGAIASHDARDDMLTVWVSAQDSHRQLAGLAKVLDRAEEAIHVVVPDVGGAFGSKGAPAPETMLVAAAAIATGRTVKWAEDRGENFVASYQGRGVEAELELAFDAGGRMLALRARIWADLGGYLMPTTAIPGHTTAMLMCGVYDIRAADVELIGRRTNKVPTGPYRGAGRPEAAYFLECTVDVAARQLGLDPLELRRRNLIRELPYETALGWTYDSGDYARCLELAEELVEPERLSDGERVVGTGFGMYVERAGGQYETAEAELLPDGRVLVRSGSSPHGQGHDTTFAQLAAERLGIELADVELRFGDSKEVPRGVGTFASRSVAMGGSAVVEAADALRERCRSVAARLLAVAEDELEWKGGGRLAAPHGRSVTLSELAAAEPDIRVSARFSSDLSFSSGAYGAVVEIERATGRLRVLRLAAVDDAGTIVNPLLAEGQVIGGTAQGLGQCLVEEAAYDEAGNPTFASFVGYSLLTAAEMPPVTTAFVESPSPLNPLGAKGIGEGGSIGTPGAVANAVADALGGARVDPPFGEDKLWRALREAGR